MSFREASKKADKVAATPVTTLAHGRSTPVYRLSKKNLRIHDAASPQQNLESRVNLIQQELPQSPSQSSYGQIFGDMDNDWEDEDLDMYSEEMSVRRAASLEALKVYAGAFASFQADSHAQMAQKMLDESGIGFGDLDRLDLGQLASELVHVEVTLDDTRGSCIGSPSPSSDTLSVSRYREIVCANKERTTNRKRIGVRRRDTLDRTKMPRST